VVGTAIGKDRRITIVWRKASTTRIQVALGGRRAGSNYRTKWQPKTGRDRDNVVKKKETARTESRRPTRPSHGLGTAKSWRKGHGGLNKKGPPNRRPPTRPPLKPKILSEHRSGFKSRLLRKRKTASRRPRIPRIQTAGGNFIFKGPIRREKENLSWHERKAQLAGKKIPPTHGKKRTPLVTGACWNKGKAHGRGGKGSEGGGGGGKGGGGVERRQLDQAVEGEVTVLSPASTAVPKNGRLKFGIG